MKTLWINPFFYVLIISLFLLNNCAKKKYKTKCCTGEIRITPCLPMDSFKIFAPNAFTPSGDGINEVFQLSFDRISAQNFNWKVYKKKKLLFESEDINSWWNGTTDSDNDKVKEGIYRYEVSCETDLGVPLKAEGEFCLILGNHAKNTPIDDCSSCVFPDMIDARAGLIYNTAEYGLEGCE